MKSPRCAVAPAKANETKTSQEIAEKWSKMAQNDAKKWPKLKKGTVDLV